jgi:myo-inositol-1-phosphate synthase
VLKNWLTKLTSKRFENFKIYTEFEEDIGPVSREHRDVIWNKFSDLTKQMHEEVLFENQRGTELENLEKKKKLLLKLKF